jgi:hypothetical protein
VHRPSNGDNEVIVKTFFVVVQSPIDFDVEDIYNGLRYGIQDAMQDADLNATVKYSVGELPTFADENNNLVIDPTVAFTSAQELQQQTGE